MGDLFDATPTERVSKVYFEDKLFDTWTHGRTILIGDGTFIQQYLALQPPDELPFLFSLTL